MMAGPAIAYSLTQMPSWSGWGHHRWGHLANTFNASYNNGSDLGVCLLFKFVKFPALDFLFVSLLCAVGAPLLLQGEPFNTLYVCTFVFRQQVSTDSSERPSSHPSLYSLLHPALLPLTPFKPSSIIHLPPPSPPITLSTISFCLPSLKISQEYMGSTNWT